MSIYTFEIKIIGTDTYYGEQPLYSDIIDGTEKIINCKTVNIIPSTEFEKTEYDGGILHSNKKSNLSGELEFQPFTNPLKATGLDEFENAVSFETFFDYKAALNKEFVYLYSEDYQVVLADLAKVGKCLRVDFTSETTDLQQSGFKKYVKLGFSGGKNS